MFSILSEPVFWMFLFLLALGAILLLYAVSLTQQTALLRREGVTGAGRLEAVRHATRLLRVSHGVGAAVPICIVTVSFSDLQGRTRKAEIEVSRAFGETLIQGDTLPLRFHPRSPSLVEVEPEGYRKEAAPAYLLAALILGLCLWIALTRMPWGGGGV